MYQRKENEKGDMRNEKNATGCEVIYSNKKKLGGYSVDSLQKRRKYKKCTLKYEDQNSRYNMLSTGKVIHAG